MFEIGDNVLVISGKAVPCEQIKHQTTVLRGSSKEWRQPLWLLQDL